MLSTDRRGDITAVRLQHGPVNAWRGAFRLALWAAQFLARTEKELAACHLPATPSANQSVPAPGRGSWAG